MAKSVTYNRVSSQKNKIVGGLPAVFFCLVTVTGAEILNMVAVNIIIMF